MTRLGLWGPKSSFKDAIEFAKNVKSPAAMECIAMELKSRGMYLARTLSYADAEFQICEADLPPGFDVLHTDCADLWMRLLKCMSESPVKAAKNPLGVYWSQNQAFWKSFLGSHSLALIFVY
jgi:hypothetical protein